MAEEIVIDTSVLQKANAPISPSHRMGQLFVRRIRLLSEIRRGNMTVLYSPRLVHEYRKQVPRPRNDFVTAFFEIIAQGRHSLENWSPWPGRSREKARKCRFPIHDDHVLRTAIRPDPTAIITEESRMLQTDECIYREFRVHVRGI